MNDEHGGYPPGTNYKPASERPGYQSEAQRRQQKHSKTLSDLQKAMPADMIRGQPIDYDDYGIPTNIPEPPATTRVQAAMQEEGELLESTPVAQQPRNAPMNQAAMQERGVKPTPKAPPPKEQQSKPLPPPLGPLEEPDNLQSISQAEADQRRRRMQAEKAREMESQIGFGVPPHKKSQHPVIQKLLKRFGLKKAKKYNLDIFSDDDDNSHEKTSYTMTLLPDELNTWALAEAQKKALSIGEAAVGIFFEHLVVCSSVVAIDGVPTWRVFEIKPEIWEAEDLVEDEYNIPTRIRKTCGLQLAELLWSETRPLTEKLSDFYQNKILDKKKITSSFDVENLGTYRYVCIQDTCSTVEILKPETDADGMEQIFFCKYCGGPMVKAADLAEERSAPLG